MAEDAIPSSTWLSSELLSPRVLVFDTPQNLIRQRYIWRRTNDLGQEEGEVNGYGGDRERMGDDIG